jgi:hypothetical protein
MDLLEIYLNDHLAGSALGSDLARRALSSNEGNDYGKALSWIATEIEEDRDSLAAMIDGLGYSRNRLKEGGAWLAEKIGRLKMNGQITGYSDLSRLIEIEGLSLGVNGKLSLWENLRASFGPTVGGVALEPLVERGVRQRDELESLRTEAAKEAFADAAQPAAG